MHQSRRALVAILSVTLLAACDNAVAPGPAASLAIERHLDNAVSGVAFGTQPIIRVLDTKGQLVSSSDGAKITATIVSGTGTLQGATSATVIAGVATFSTLRIDGYGGHQLSYTMNGVTSAQSLVFDVRQTIGSLRIDGAPDTLYSGRFMPTRWRVSIRDKAGLIVVSSSASVSASITNGSGRLVGTTTATAFDGQSVFSAFGVVGAGLHTIDFTGVGQRVSSASLPVVTAPPLQIADFALGSNHACVVAVAGPTYCWGRNNEGQLGDGTLPLFSRAWAAPLLGGNTFTRLAAGIAHTCGIDDAQAIWCWGTNRGDVLGEHLNAPAPWPRALPSNERFRSVSSNAFFTCALTLAGVAHCWGDNALGFLGVGNRNPRVGLAPVSGTQSFSTLAVSGVGTCALTALGKAFCWGGAEREDSASSAAYDIPFALPTPYSFTALAYRTFYGCGRVADGNWYCWRDQEYRGGSESTGSSNITNLAPDLSSLVSISLGRTHSCGLTADGQAMCWGSNEYGELGTGTTTPLPTPTPVASSLRFTRIVSGHSYTCATSITRALYCWGLNADGQLGDSTFVNRTVPTPMTPP